MAKKLVSEKTVETFITGDTFYMDGSIILTPSAKDVLRNKGVAIVYGPKPEAGDPATCDKESLEATVAALLKQEYGITDGNQLKAVSDQVIEAIKKNK